MAASLRAELTRTGTPPASALRGVDNVPEGLTQRTVYGWLHREITSADPRHWEFVIRHLRGGPTIVAPARVD